MHWALFLGLLVMSCVSGTLLAYWLAVAYHLVRTTVNIPTARAGLYLAASAQPAGLPSVCIIIPAHNEEQGIAELVHSLLAQDYPHDRLNIVFALDRCTDKTRRVIEQIAGDDERVQIAEIAECPPDWAGKVHAIHRAVSDTFAAKIAEILIFADADTSFDPACVRACVNLLLSRELGMLSLLSTLSHRGWYEKYVQPAAGMELIRQYPIERANVPDASRRRAFANGQFLMFTREAYAKVGGHESARHALLEDVQLARACAREDVRAGLFLAAGMVRCRMYASWDEFCRGWERIYIESTNRKPTRLRALAWRVAGMGVVGPLASLGSIAVGISSRMDHPGLAAVTIGLGTAALVVMLLTLIGCYRAGRTPIRYALAYPFGAWQVSLILLQAARDLATGVPVRWGGREYVLTPR